jgi:hypothetical protein
MKTQAEVDRALRTLRRALRSPCDCAGGEHALRCQIGGIMIVAVCDALGWVLGRNAHFERDILIGLETIQAEAAAQVLRRRRTRQ